MNELKIPIPNSIIGHAHQHRMSPQIAALCRAMAQCGYWPSDFAEPTDPVVWNADMTNLVFVGIAPVEGDDGTVATAEYFIRCGGDV